MNKNEKELLMQILEALNKCENKLERLESNSLDEITLENYEDIVTPITEEMFDAIVKATGSRLVFMAIA
ncbi:MAG TPA: hypothetical protein DF712_00060 [Balneola sp.]|nr:hypothetical protein [Balneola sp.]|tara:strand:- start:534 stop:740 length:207 start_codon:yes stop_codon:yes gene_type:complete